MTAARPDRRLAGTLVAISFLLVAFVGTTPTRAAAPPAAAPRVVLAFQPGGGVGADPVLDRLRARPELAVGLMSSTQGTYRRHQALLDMTAGTRTSAAAYALQRVPRFALAKRADGRDFVTDWTTARQRADSALADIRPGLLASSIPGGAAFVGLRSRPGVDGVVAADREGDIASVSLGASADEPQRVRAALRRHRFVVASLATGARGEHALDALIAQRRSSDLLIVVESPPQRPAQLLPVGVAGLGSSGAITSTTTRLRGLVAGIDVPATVLGHLGIAAPSIKGQRIRSGGARNLDELVALEARLRVVAGRRVPTLLALLLCWAGLILLLGLIADRRGVRAGMRIGGLAVLWVPPLLLLTAALEPGRAGELTGLAGGAMVLGALTDRLVRFPRAPAVPAAATLVVYALDLAAGSPLIIRSLLGVNPRSGARFYGVGNELEAVLSVVVLVGVGALLSGRRSSYGAAGAFAGVGVVLAAVVGAGSLGADVGGVLTVAAGTAVATILMLPGALTRQRLALAVLTPAAALVALAALDLATAGNGHFSRTILDARGGQDLWDVAERRSTLAWNVLSTGTMPFLAGVALLAGAYALRFRERIYRPLDGSPAWTAALTGAFTGVLAGSLVNDSGPVLLVFGTFVLATTTVYVRGAPERRRSVPAAVERTRGPAVRAYAEPRRATSSSPIAPKTPAPTAETVGGSEQVVAAGHTALRGFDERAGELEGTIQDVR